MTASPALNTFSTRSRIRPARAEVRLEQDRSREVLFHPPRVPVLEATRLHRVLARMRARVHLGRVVATPGVLHAVANDELMLALSRHASGDWGLVDASDARANHEAVEHGARILSAYETGAGVRFWVITEGDRSVTTVLLPTEY